MKVDVDKPAYFDRVCRRRAVLVDLNLIQGVSLLKTFMMLQHLTATVATQTLISVYCLVTRYDLNSTLYPIFGQTKAQLAS
jgi:hypothetical protein